MCRTKKVEIVAVVAACVLAAGRGGLLAADAAPAAGEKPAQNQTEDWMAALRKGWAEKDAYARDWDRKGPGEQIPVFGKHRQPAIVLSNQGTLLAFAEQYTGWGDVGEHEIVLKRSVDGGKTWGEQIMVFDDGKANLNGPTPVVDRTTGTVWVMFARRCKDCLVTHSTDDGLTWTEPKLIESRKGLWPGQSHGIQLSSGRMLCPARIGGGGGFWCYYSDDHGANWKKGTWFKSKSLAALLLSPVELMDGTIYGNMRQMGGRPPIWRRDTWSRDGGLTWDPPKANRALRDADGPGVKANVIRLSDERRHDRNRVVFCCPGEGGRKNPLVYISYDEFKTWSKGKQLLEGVFGYSDLVALPDHSVGVLFEGGPGKGYVRQAFLRFTMEWLTDGKEKVVPKDKPGSADVQSVSGARKDE